MVRILSEKRSIKKVIVGPSESMSKSKKNTIDPQKMVDTYGAILLDFLSYLIASRKRYTMVR